MNLLTILLLLAAFVLTRVSNLNTAVYVLLAQSAIVALACVAVGWEAGQTHTYIAALLTVAIKACLIPYALFGLVRRMRHEREVNPILGVNFSSVTAALTVLLAYGLTDRILPGMINRDVLAAAISLTLIGLLLIITRRQAIMQIVGLITMENGLYLLGLSVTKGLPLIIELGIFFDVLVAVVVLVILTYRLKLSFMTTDTSVLKKLKG